MLAPFSRARRRSDPCGRSRASESGEAEIRPFGSGVGRASRARRRSDPSGRGSRVLHPTPRMNESFTVTALDRSWSGKSAVPTLSSVLFVACVRHLLSVLGRAQFFRLSTAAVRRTPGAMMPSVAVPSPPFSSLCGCQAHARPHSSAGPHGHTREPARFCTRFVPLIYKRRRTPPLPLMLQLPLFKALSHLISATEPASFLLSLCWLVPSCKQFFPFLCSGSAKSSPRNLRSPVPLRRSLPLWVGSPESESCFQRVPPCCSLTL